MGARNPGPVLLQDAIATVGARVAHLEIHEEEPERGDVELDRARPQLPLAQQVCLILTEVALIESIRRCVKEAANRSTAFK
jgi:hypothetical protein